MRRRKLPFRRRITFLFKWEVFVVRFSYHYPKYLSTPFAIPCTICAWPEADAMYRSSVLLDIKPISTIVTGIFAQLIPVISSPVRSPRFGIPVVAQYESSTSLASLWLPAITDDDRYGLDDDGI